MFICEKCLNKYEIDPFYKTFGLHSRGPCEMCDKTGICLDWHGDLKKKAKKPSSSSPSSAHSKKGQKGHSKKA